MQNTSELEQMVNLLALTADVMRKLAKPQEQSEQEVIRGLADDVENVADRLVEVLFPKNYLTKSATERTSLK